MTESISEGTVSQLPKPVGCSVAVDEIVAVLETDKVTFEVRSTESGTIKAIQVKNGDNVAVGSPLIIIDTDGEASKTAETAPSTKGDTVPSHPQGNASIDISAADSDHSHSHRTPMIQFRYGIRDPTVSSEGFPSGAHSKSPLNPSSSQSKQKPASSKAAISYLDLPPMFGRPKISPLEESCINSGGVL
jgi:pyruvate/2-oxoglutarate dehydrogenase complex dihydrolipoamide acyltransferase (E2) component